MNTEATTAAADVIRYVPTGTATRRLGMHADTLRKLGQKGKIRFERTPSGRLLWDIEGYLAGASKGGGGK